MTHLSEASHRLSVIRASLHELHDLAQVASDFDAVYALVLPSAKFHGGLDISVLDAVAELAHKIGPSSVLVTIGDPEDLVHIHEWVSPILHYQLWVSVKRTSPIPSPDNSTLPNGHFGLLIHSKYSGALKHAKTRVQYSFCPACGKTTKDYGGKKHTFNSNGTLLSDVWRDISCDYSGDLDAVIIRLADLFGINPYQELFLYDLRNLPNENRTSIVRKAASSSENKNQHAKAASFLYADSTIAGSYLRLGDCLRELAKVPDDSVDFAFADPPYNLKKAYHGYNDDIDVVEYFSWCDKWLVELARVLRPGRTLALLNIPLWAVRHYHLLERILDFQSWIAWDSLSFPVRQIMPAHYTILCFSKGKPRTLPGLLEPQEDISELKTDYSTDSILFPRAQNYCSRTSCVLGRLNSGESDKTTLSDLWWDIHRLKHNTRRVDHPCQLPPLLMYRLIALYTKSGEMVLDCFNGAGTTTLAAAQLGRRYIGIEASLKYDQMARSRHNEIRLGIDPFRKQKQDYIEKNSRVKRLPRRRYEVTKKELQLEVKRVSQLIERNPTRNDMVHLGQYPIEYYDEYFINWGEIRAAVRQNGVPERNISANPPDNLDSDDTATPRGEHHARR